MIEVEKKLYITPKDIDRITGHHVPIQKITFADVFFDTQDYQLTSKDWWLRKRDNKWELKIRDSGHKRSNIDSYHEITDSADIAQKLSLSPSQKLQNQLKRSGIKPFAKIITKRTIYKIKPYSICIDKTDFGYNLCEIEIMTQKRENIAKATKQINRFIIQNNLNPQPVRVKLIEYLKRNNKKHYNTLITKGIINS